MDFKFIDDVRGRAMTLKEQAINVLFVAMQSPKVAATVSAGTTGAGIGTYLDLIPEGIGKLATLVGIILSLVLIYVHLRKFKLDSRHIELEMKILRQREEDRRAEIAQRKEQGELVRRSED